jgi:hypothetical protein
MTSNIYKEEGEVLEEKPVLVPLCSEISNLLYLYGTVVHQRINVDIYSNCIEKCTQVYLN